MEHVIFKYVPRDLWITVPQQLLVFPINARSRPFVMMFEYFYFHFRKLELIIGRLIVLSWSSWITRQK